MRFIITTLFVALSINSANAQVGFTLEQTLDLSSTTPWLYGDYLQLVDVTGDGVRDLLTIDSSSLETYQHDGLTGFVEIATSPLAMPGTLAAVADVNNDGSPDVLVRFTTGYASMISDGTGGFLQAGLYLTAADVGQVLVGDFNGDGNLDVAAARNGGGVFGGAGDTEIDVRFGDGTGVFGAPVGSDVPVGLNYAAVIDLDENGTDDLLLSGVVELTFAFIADGLVTNYDNYPAGSGDAPQDIRVADLNDDAHLDVMFTCPLMDRVGVLLLDGTGLMGIFQDYVVGGNPVTVRPGDINGDTIPDMLTTTDVGFEWRLGIGDGTFSLSANVPMTTSDARFAVGDATNDGLAEIAILSTNTVSVLRNTTSPSGPGDFVRGDANTDGAVQISDADRTLQALFLTGSPTLDCADSADANDDGIVDVSDVVFLLYYLFVPGSPVPPPPGVSSCGADPTPDSLTDCGVIMSCP